MTSKNHITFLNCPANQTGAVGGTPPTRGVIGGQFKKETWVSAHEAALEGLPAVIRGDQALAHCLAPDWLSSLSGGVVNQRATFGVRPALVLYAMPEPLFGKQHLAGQRGVTFTLKCDGKLFRARAGTVGYVLQVATGRINPQGESVALFNAQALPISFKVHG